MDVLVIVLTFHFYRSMDATKPGGLIEIFFIGWTKSYILLPRREVGVIYFLYTARMVQIVFVIGLLLQETACAAIYPERSCALCPSRASPHTSA